MSASNVPFQLRPNKFIDRQLFLDLLSRLIPKNGNERYVYVSMGGQHLADHKAVYRQLGIPHLFSFDLEERVVKRQNFNRPISKARCQKMHSSALPGKIDEIFGIFNEAKSLVVWLDYTKPGERRTQLQEMIEVLGHLQPGDILKITLNADNRTLAEGAPGTVEEESPFPPVNKLRRLQAQLAEFVPTNTAPIDKEDLPGVLVNCVKLAVSKAEGEREGIIFKPELLTTYRDGQQMVTITVRALSGAERGASSVNLRRWDFRARNWTNLVRIQAPDLSAKEKMRIDQYLHRRPTYILERLNFLPEETRQGSLEAIKSYKKLHRYYPDFRNIEP